MSGAVLYEDCPCGGGPRHCKCGRCALCGFAKHTATHGPVNGGGRGSYPFDHQYVPDEATRRYYDSLTDKERAENEAWGRVGEEAMTLREELEKQKEGS